MSNIQAKFLGLYLLALAQANDCAECTLATLAQIRNLELQLEQSRDLSETQSNQHGQVLRTFLALDRTCRKFGINRLLRRSLERLKIAV
jgi:hypothetical protein